MFFFFFFNDTATTEIYTLSLHDALPISKCCLGPRERCMAAVPSAAPSTLRPGGRGSTMMAVPCRSEEHTSELQSQSNLVCRLLLEKKKKRVRAYELAIDQLRSRATGVVC